MKLTIDFESRSTCDIKKRGAWVYSADPTTQIWCCAAKADDLPARIWVAPWALPLLPAGHGLPLIPCETLFDLLEKADVIEAHNSGFEVCMWQNTAIPKYGWPPLPHHKIRCSASKAAYHALPRALGQACEALGLEQQKDNEGYRLMMRMCRPRKPTKASKAIWHEEPGDIVRLAQYCLQDTRSEEALSQALKDLPPQELRIWQLDQAINARGIQADIESAKLMVSEINAFEERLLEETARLTNQSVSSPKQIAATRQWLLGQGVATESLDKAAVAALLAKKDLPAAARRVLEIRQQLGKSSTSKYQGILDRASKDGRIRGALMYHGAATGRWCMPGDAEVLTPQGWEPLCAWHGGPIMTWAPDGSLAFDHAEPNAFTFSGELYGVENKKVSFAVTPEHTIPYYHPNHIGELRTMPAKDLIGPGAKCLMLSGEYKGEVLYSEMETRLFVAIQADGHITKRATPQITFHLRKERKIARLLRLLQSLGISYRHSEYKDSDVIAIKKNDLPDFLFGAKQFGPEILKHSPAVFVDELRFWDSQTHKEGLNLFTYSTTNEANASWVSTMAHLAGMAATRAHRDGRKPGHNRTYSVTIRDRRYVEVRKRDFVRRQYVGSVYCPTTNSGFFLARYAGKIHVTGNSGQGVQLQNLPRGVIPDPELALEALHSGGFELIDMVWGDPMGAASSCIRSLIQARPGHELICADFSSIEARVNAWVAGEEPVIQAFRAGLDLYKVAAAGIFNRPYDKIDKQQRQVGKCSVLALGYGGGIGAYAAMAKGYGVDLETIPAFVLPGVAEDIIIQGRKTAGSFGKNHPGIMSPEAALACDVIKQLWRRANPRIVQLWAGLEEAALMAVAKPGGVYSYGSVKYGVVDDFLKCRLPSGRLLHYYKPSIESKMTDWGQEKAFIAFWSMDPKTKQWAKSLKHGLYGGLLCENCLASDTRVLTASGVKSITEVTPEDLVWDGVEWVSTDGCVYKGEQEVGEWLGIRSTQDHLILAGRSWITAIAGTEPVMQDALSLARDSVASLCWSQRTQTTENLCADATAGMNTESKTAACTGGIPKVAESVGTISRVSPTPRSEATLQLSPTRQPGSCGCTGIPGSSHAATTQTTRPTQTMVAGGSGSAMNGAMTEKPSSATPSPCPDGVTQPLSWTELTTGADMNLGMYGSYPAPSTPGTDGQIALSNTTGSGCPFQSSSRGLPHCGLGLQHCIGISAKESPLSGLWATTGRREAVYDLLNCGPRSRFTIITNSGPVIVHNCVQALSRDLMAEAMLRVEAAGYPVVLSVHDELVSEIPVGFGSLDEYEKLMAMTPAWAEGCPINAEGWRGPRYRKG